MINLTKIKYAAKYIAVAAFLICARPAAVWGATVADFEAALAVASGKSAGQRVLYIAELFVGCPYQAGLLEGREESLVMPLDRFDCTTFVETCMAGAMASPRHYPTVSATRDALKNIRYRGGVMDGYASRLHYVSEWIVDNSARGNLREVTAECGPVRQSIKTLDFMSGHASLYNALADSINMSGIRSAEAGLRKHRFNYIPTASVSKCRLCDGDIVVIVTSKPGLDASHMGVVKYLGGVPHLLHASSKAGEVIVDPASLSDYLKRNRSALGVRVVRLTQ